MKRLILMTTAALSLAVFTACGNNDSQNGEQNGNDTITEQNGAEDFYDQDAGDSHNDHVEDAADMEDEDTM
jgi:hypothetical protein